jgi:hypothetical protein
LLVLPLWILRAWRRGWDPAIGEFFTCFGRARKVRLVDVSGCWGPLRGTCLG